MKKQKFRTLQHRKLECSQITLVKSIAIKCTSQRHSELCRIKISYRLAVKIKHKWPLMFYHAIWEFLTPTRSLFPPPTAWQTMHRKFPTRLVRQAKLHRLLTWRVEWKLSQAQETSVSSWIERRWKMWKLHCRWLVLIRNQIWRNPLQ